MLSWWRYQHIWKPGIPRYYVCALTVRCNYEYDFTNDCVFPLPIIDIRCWDKQVSILTPGACHHIGYPRYRVRSCGMGG
jgi:hypothetical protein